MVDQCGSGPNLNLSPMGLDCRSPFGQFVNMLSVFVVLVGWKSVSISKYLAKLFNRPISRVVSRDEEHDQFRIF